jgi:hypothetical protein
MNEGGTARSVMLDEAPSRAMIPVSALGVGSSRRPTPLVRLGSGRGFASGTSASPELAMPNPLLERPRTSGPGPRAQTLR